MMAGSSALVIGGGPAGGVLAAHLARHGRRVTVVERSSGPHDKVCGEFLSEEAARALSGMGIDLAALGASSQISAVRLHEASKSVAVELPFRAYSLSRRILDEAILAAALSFGAELRRGVAIRSLERRGSMWLARAAGGGALSADSVFLATGKHDLRGWRRPASRNDLIGFKLHLRLAEGQVARLRSHVELFVFPGGYAGLTLVEDNIANLCLVVTRRMFVRIGGWDALLASLRAMPAFDQRLAGCRPFATRPLAISAIPYGHVQSESEGIWRLGDQAAVIPSFCGEGMAMALQSALMASQYYCAGQSAVDFQRSFARRVRAQVKLTALLSPILMHPQGQALAMRLATLAPKLVSQVALRSRTPRIMAGESLSVGSQLNCDRVVELTPGRRGDRGGRGA